MCIHSSNRMEALLELFKKNFLSSPSPFTKRLVVVPSPIMRSWLLKEMAQDPDLSIAMGVEVVYIDQAVARLGKLCGSADREKGFIPSQLEMAFAIEHEIKQVLSEEQSDLWEPLFLYLSKEAGQKGEKRLAALAEELAKYFLQYGIYAGRMLEEWKAAPPSGWQQALYLRVMGRYPSWSEPYRELSAISEAPSRKQDLQLHLFGINFFSKLHHDFLKKVSRSYPVAYYLLSPCEMFWGDIASDSELAAMRKRWSREGVSQEGQEELDYYLTDRNVLLANLGRLGRKMLGQIEDDAAFEGSHHEDPGEGTLLSSVQSDMLYLKNREEKAVMPSDSSIQVHKAPSRFREVQIAYQEILRLIDTEGYSPGEIIVMAPDIHLYAPYIKTVFSDSDAPLETVIFDLQLSSQSSVAQSFKTLLGIADSRFEASKLLQFFETKEAMRRHGISRENTLLLKSWVKEAGIRWGEDIHHRNELVARDCCRYPLPEDGDKGTWEAGFKRLLSGLMMSAEDDEAPRVSLTESDLLEKALVLVRSLREDLNPLKNNQSLPLHEWSRYLRCLYEAYFAIDRRDEKAAEEEENLFALFDRFAKAGAHFADKKLSWQSIRHHLDKMFQESTMPARESCLSAVKFCSMFPMRAIPAKAVLLMGMDEESFPKNDNPSPLDMSRGSPQVDYCPAALDFDRTLFLEALLSARDYLLMTYTDEKGETAPSLLVGELMDYLDDNYEIEGKKPSDACLRVHPFDGFDPRYFQGANSLFVSYSQRDYDHCRASLNPKKPASSFFPEFFIEGDHSLDDNLAEENTILLKDLFSLGKNPMRTYFRSLGIFLNDDERHSDEDQLDLSHLQKYQIRMDALDAPIEKVLAKAERQSAFPQGLFKQVWRGDLEEDIAAMKSFLHSHGIDESSLFAVELSRENGDLPPIECSRAVLMGKMDCLCSEGLIVHATKDVKDLAVHWPRILLLNCISEMLEGKTAIKRQVFFLKAKKCLPVCIEDPFLWLDRYVDYYLLCQKNPSPMLPEWFELLFKGTDLDKAIDEQLAGKYNKSFNREMLFSMQNKQKFNQLHMEKWRRIKESIIDLNHEVFEKK